MSVRINRPVGYGILALIGLLLLSGIPFVVDATECAVRTRFGRPVEVIQQPGLHFKLPLVDDVTRLDARLLYFDPPTAEFLTEDKKNVVISSFVVWRIEDPLRFIQKLYTRENAEARIADLAASELGTALGRVPFSRLVSAVEDEARLAETSAGIAEKVRQRAAEDYGVRVVDVGIRRLAFPDQNREAVFNRMRAERERIARRFRSEGEEEAIKIRAEAEKERSKLLAEAYRLAAELKGKGEAEAARIYADAVSRDPDLYRFLRTLESYDKVLDEKTTLILPGDSQLLRLLTEGPSRGGTGAAR
ncbi:MAG TPA: protease modulator HflC [Gaiellaceae bacterium]